MSNDFVEEHFQRITSDLEYRKNLIANPKEVLGQEYGCSIAKNTNIEIVEQDEDTIIIMLPAKPESEDDILSELELVTEQVVDLLYVDGIGGYLVPNDDQKWELRNMRKAWIEKLGLDLMKL
ncbi:nitrile hydratase subunit alpha [Aquella oligotrophica]|uniref:Nitrile hydratase alpha/Thiocyanate hydrolase gamma domain-containing protein n=1 Tax=Aquella oligotrophica TaxID=2067065 RepID=A0A2I7N7Z4_9NEIS|nr:nitrile hydratase subunit alpha [Aquella oligotrophica]AUR52571.1 hypothetical protein CUN60_09765 [Aquella oligotrophica]